MAYLFAAYFVLWALVFGYVLSVSSRQRQLERDIARLLRLEEERGKS